MDTTITVTTSLYSALAITAAVFTAARIWLWAADQYDVTFTRRRVRVTRRWYGTRAHVTRAGDADGDDPDLYVVLDRDDDDLPVPWLKVHKLDKDYISSWAEDAEAFWAPVTDFAPYTVRRFRPHVLHYGRIPVVWLVCWLPPRRPAGYLGDA